MTTREEASPKPRHHRGRDNATGPVLLLRSVNENCAFNGVIDNAQSIARAEMKPLSEEFLPAHNNPTLMRGMMV
jgi:hypothetical protein